MLPKSGLGAFVSSDFAAASWQVSLPENAATATFSTGGIDINGFNALSLYNALWYKANGSCTKDRWTLTMDVTCTALGTSAGGIGLGIYGANNNGGNVARVLAYTVLNAAADTNNGKSFLATASNTNTAFASLATSTSTGVITTFAAGQVFRLTLAFDRGTFTYTCTNQANAQSSSATFSGNFTYVSPGGYVAGLPYNNYLGIFPVGGRWNVTAFSATTSVEANAEVVVVGDSKTQGYDVGAYANRFTERLALLRNTPVPNLGGAGDTVADVNGRLKEIQQLASKRIVLCVGRNDTFGTAFQTAYQNLVTTLQGYGATVYHAQTMSETAKDNTSLRNWLSTTYGSAVIDTYTPTLPYVDPGDGAHLTAGTAQQVADTLHNALPAFTATAAVVASTTYALAAFASNDATLVASSGTITTTATNAAYGHTGLETGVKIPANGAFSLVMQHSTTNGNGVLGVHTAAAQIGYNAMLAGFFWGQPGATDLYVQDLPTSPSPGVHYAIAGTSAISGTLYARLARAANSAALTVETSPDKTTWTLVKTLQAASAADLWIVCDLYGASGTAMNAVQYLGTVPA
ncbi:MAG: hypothetical protein NVS3B25_07410 [Hymenobacter sp.]